MANKHENKEPIKKENGDKSQWRPTDEQTKEQTENPTGIADKSPAEKLDDCGRSPGKAQGESFEQ